MTSRVEKMEGHEFSDFLRKNPDARVFTAERALEIAGSRYNLRALEFCHHFLKTGDVLRLGVVGIPNRGKTTLAYSAHKTLLNSNVPTWYCGLDIYSDSGPAIAGLIEWQGRGKCEDASEEEVRTSIEIFKALGPGLVIGDFPGRLNNPYQTERLETLDLALILYSEEGEKEAWLSLASETNVSCLTLRTAVDELSTFSQESTLYDLDRDYHVGSFGMMVLLTRVLDVYALKEKIKLIKLENMFDIDELLCLGMSDLLFAPQLEGVW